MHPRDLHFAAIWRRSGPRWGIIVAALLSCSVLMTAALMYWYTSAKLFETLDQSVVEQLELLSARPPTMLTFMITSRLQRPPPVVTQVGLFTANRKPIVGDVSVIPRKLRLDSKAHEVRAPVAPDHHWRAAGRQIPDGRILIVARGADEIITIQRGLLRAVGIILIPGIFLSLAAGATIGVNSERRLRQINSIAEQIIEGDLTRRLPVGLRSDELDRLCIIVNRILDRLESGIDALSSVGENIAHDVRTPLTTVRTRIERSLNMCETATPLALTLEQSLRGIDQALSITTALLRIASIQHGKQAAAFRSFDLAEVVHDTAEVFGPVAESKGQTLRTVVSGAAAITGDRALIVEALVNLVDNAIKFTPDGGRIEIVLNGTARQPILSVSDTGIGIPIEHQQDVLRRFYRVEKSRTTPGTGLGLSLVAAIAELHNFELSISELSPGCRVTLKC